MSSMTSFWIGVAVGGVGVGASLWLLLRWVIRGDLRQQAKRKPDAWRDAR
jgi:hypothetical protein